MESPEKVSKSLHNWARLTAAPGQRADVPEAAVGKIRSSIITARGKVCI